MLTGMRLVLAVLAAALAVPAAAHAAPWPTMRHDQRNTGSSDAAVSYSGDRPWSFRTGKGIFSTPVIGNDGTAYVGSADHVFYALGRRGKVRWRFRTGGIIDAAASLERGALTFGSGDEMLRRVRTTKRRISRRKRLLWRFEATRKPATGQLVNWWEGNVATGPDGDIYAGNTGGAAYRISRDGRQRWAFQTGNSVWTTPAFGPDGSTYWGSLDLNVYALDANGAKRWSTTTLGYVVSSPALARDGTLYVGSFDGRLHALDSASGNRKWVFATHDHVYSSPALAEGADGSVESIVVASTDGSVYAVGPDGQERWRYDTGDPVRSSPVIGREPGGDGRVVYVGAADGTLYALDLDTGVRRWSYDTTPSSPVLRDRNDLNGSPALGRTGIYIGGEHGRVVYVPYDWCLHGSDPRCSTSPGQPFGDDLTRVFPVTSGGTTRPEGLGSGVSTATALPTRLVVRQGGRTSDASLQPLPSAESLVSSDPPFGFRAQVSGDGHNLFVVPDGFLSPDTDYRVTVSGLYTSDGLRPIGGPIGATGGGRVDDTVAFRTASYGGRLPLTVGRRRVSALRLRRLAVPLPPFLTSVNQIGFDQYELLAGTLSKTPPDANGEGRVLLWVIATRRGRGGVRVADPKGGFGFPIAGRYRGDTFLLQRRDLPLTFSFGEVPMDRFELRGRLAPDRRTRPGASLYAEAVCTEVPNYGPQLIAIGLCNAQNILPASGTFLMGPYSRRGRANVRPRGVRLGALALQRPSASGDGAATADLRLHGRRARYRARDHVVSIVLTDADTDDPVAIDYVKSTAVEADARGNARNVKLTIPRGTELPARVRAYLVTDAFPLASRVLE